MVSPRRTALLLLAGLVLAACEPKEEADCDQLLADEKYGQVVKSCEDPSQRAMGYLGLAGFDFLDFIAADDPSNLIVQLGLNAANISLKRELINDAVREVASPTSGQQAFMLLLSAFLGLSVTTTEFLDNGAGATALDHDIVETEVRDATGMVVKDPPPLVPLVLGASPDYQMAVSGTPYTVECPGDVPPAPPAPTFCDDDPVGRAIHDDVSPLLGAGLDVTSPDSVGVVPGDADSASQIMMLLDIDLPITADPAKADRLDSFLAAGTLDPNFPVANPDLFPIGMLGYLELMVLANLELIASAGGDIEAADSTLNKTIDELRAALDNGAACFKDADADPVKSAAAAPLNLLYAIYVSAPGTAQLAVPDPEDYTTFNIVPNDELEDKDGNGFLDLVPFVPVPNGADYAFGGGTLSMGYKMLYPKVDGLLAFNRDKATPRIDQTPADFQADFETLPRIAPNASQAGDGAVTMIELICLAGDA